MQNPDDKDVKELYVAVKTRMLHVLLMKKLRETEGEKLEEKLVLVYPYNVNCTVSLSILVQNFITFLPLGEAILTISVHCFANSS